MERIALRPPEIYSVTSENEGSFNFRLGMKLNGLCMGHLVVSEKNNEVDHSNMVGKLILHDHNIFNCFGIRLF